MKQIAVKFIIYADCESLLSTSYTEKYQVHIPCSFAYKVLSIDDKFSKPAVLYRGKNVVDKLIKAIVKEYDCCKKVIIFF